MNIQANTAAFSKGVAQASSLVTSFASTAVQQVAKVGDAFKHLGGFALKGMGLGAGFSVGQKFGDAINSGIEATLGGIGRIDALGDAAQELGTTTKGLSELRYAADLSGSSAADLDAALTKMNANLGDSVSKATPAGKALDDMGLDARKLAEMDPTEAFKKISDGFAKIPNQAQKSAAAMDIFGKGGIKVLNTLGEGSKGLERLSEEARKFGVSISQVDQAKIAVAKDALDRAGYAIEGIGNKLAVSLAPYLDAGITQLTEWFSQWFDGGKVIDTVLDGVVHGVASVIDFGWKLRDNFLAVWEFIQGTIEKTIAVVRGFGKAISDLFHLFRAEAAAGDPLATATERLQKYTSPGDKLISSYEQVRKKAEEAAKATAKIAEAQAKVGKTVGGMTDEEKKVVEDMGKAADAIFDKTRTPFEKYREELENIDELIRSRLIDRDTAKRAKGAAAHEFAGGNADKFGNAADLKLGSKSAVETIFVAQRNARLGGAGGDPVVRNQQEQLVVAREGNNLLKAIAQKKREEQVVPL